MRNNIFKLAPEKVSAACEMLKQELKDIMKELHDRILEKPNGEWIMGSDKPIKCKCVDRERDVPVVNPLPDPNCFLCKGKGEYKEWPLHFTWGMAVRNLLRDKGYGEKYFDVDNLDDYYVELIEKAATEYFYVAPASTNG